MTTRPACSRVMLALGRALAQTRRVMLALDLGLSLERGLALDRFLALGRGLALLVGRALGLSPLVPSSSS